MGGERRQQKRRQDRDDGDDHQQFNQGETLTHDKIETLYPMQKKATARCRAAVSKLLCTLDLLLGGNGHVVDEPAGLWAVVLSTVA